MNLIYLRAASVWTPARLFAASEDGFWYDPSDLSTLWKDTAGTDPVTADGDLVARIDDKSGNGNHATQATSANRPAYKTSGGLHWLQFDGTNDKFTTAAIDKTGWTDAMLITGGNAAAGQGLYIDGLDNSGSVNHEPFTDNNWYCAFGGATRVNVTSLSYNTAYVLTRRHTAGATTFRRNGTAVGGSTSMTTNFGGNAIVHVGENGQGYLNGRLYSAICLARDPTTGEVTSAESWVARKTGVTL